MFVPDVFGVSEDDSDELSLFVVDSGLLDRSARDERSGLAWRGRSLVDLLRQCQRITAEQPHEQHQDERAKSAADHHRTAHSAAIFDVLAFPITLPPHGSLLVPEKGVTSDTRRAKGIPP